MSVYHDIELIRTEDIIDKFLDSLMILHEERNSDEIKKVLGLYEIENTNNNKSNNEINIKYVTVKSNNHIKRTINVVRHIIPERLLTIWIESIVSKWIDGIKGKSSSDIEFIVNDCKFDDSCKANQTVNFNINEALWDLFILSCKRSDCTISDGFKCAMSYYVKNIDRIANNSDIL